MGKGIAILFYVIMLPVSGLLLLTWILTFFKRKVHYPFYFLVTIWAIFFCVTGFSLIAEPYFRPMVVSQGDIYGRYIIDKNMFPGKQAQWQYENFKFKITENNELIFESRIYDNKWKTEKVKVSFSTGYFDLDKQEYCNRKIRIHSNSTNHHIIQDNPTLYRKSFNRFYYVFQSRKFGNVFFIKGKVEK